MSPLFASLMFSSRCTRSSGPSPQSPLLRISMPTSQLSFSASQGSASRFLRRCCYGPKALLHAPVACSSVNTSAVIPVHHCLSIALAIVCYCFFVVLAAHPNLIGAGDVLLDG